MTTGAEKLLQSAVDQGISVCFANPGTSEMHFVSALDTVWGVRAVLGLHETVCSGAADGYARMTRKPALTLLHLGPGLANALSNMHNADRAGSPMVNVIGDMATWHKDADPLLNMDITALAGTVSKDVIVCGEEDDAAAKMAEACKSATSPAPVGEARIATLIVPHDLSWERTQSAATNNNKKRSPTAPALLASENVSEKAKEFLINCASALKQRPKGTVAIYVGNQAALSDNGALQSAGKIAAAIGATLYCENSFARLDRGAGLPNSRRLPYFPQDAAAALAKYETLVLVDARRPVANFGYEGGPSLLINQPDSNVWELDSAYVDIAVALNIIYSELGASIKPLINCGGMFCPPSRPALAKGRLNPTSLCQVVAHLQPKDAIVVDESLTSGNAYWEASKGCPPFSHLCLTGGAIGCGPPLAVGAAIACPNRIVINLQADGSAMYSLQALWTQARENLRVVTIICANKAYAILKVEMAKQKIAPNNGPAAKALTDISNPAIDWVRLAEGMGVTAARVTSCEQLAEELTRAFDRQGPTLLEAVL